MAQNNPSREGSSTPGNRLFFVLRVLDAENRLLERADQKAISLLAALGVFMVFFIVYHRVIPINLFTVILLSIYFIVSLMAIVSFVLTVRPRIRMVEEETGDTDKAAACEPAFFVGICKFPTLSAYRQALQDMIKDEASAIDVYTRQIFGIARVNAVKYKNIQRAVLLVIIALATELALVAYLFIYYYVQGANMLPPITG
ncbi:MAG TPA: Pycsar system effector family protein [Dehalococcoidia bacterium]